MPKLNNLSDASSHNSTPESRDYIPELPIELWFKILSELVPSDRKEFGRTAHTFRQAYGRFLLDQRDSQYNHECLSQQKIEIKNLLNNKKRILENINNSEVVRNCINKLEQADQFSCNDIRTFVVKEDLINRVNHAIIHAIIHQTGIGNTTLDCSTCHLTRIPRSVLTEPSLRDYWPNLSSLNLSYNKLRAIPQEIRYLKKLRSLNLEQNELTFLPEEISQLESLEYLNLFYNELIDLPAKISCLKRLKSLRLGGNRFTILPAVIVQLTALTELYLGHNLQLSTLPSEMQMLSSLRRFSLPTSNPVNSFVDLDNHSDEL